MPKSRHAKRKLIQQVCVIPFRWRETDRQLEVCLITSLVKKRWIFPKGIVDPGETPLQAAIKEVWEEAGLRGDVVGEPLGQYDDQKWGCDLRVQVLMFQVSEMAEQWPEIDQRQREWLSPAQALERLNRSELKSFLRTACQRLPSDATTERPTLNGGAETRAVEATGFEDPGPATVDGMTNESNSV